MTSLKKQLLDLLKHFSFLKGEFTLASGKKSDFFLDCKKTLLTSSGHFLAGKLIIDELSTLQGHIDTDVHAVAGVALGGCSLASSVATLSSLWSGRRPYDALYIRQETKDHGTKNLVEGNATFGKNVALLEDVITTGGSSARALESLIKAKYNPVAIIAIVDRLEGGADMIREKFQIPVVSIFTLEDIK